MIDVANPRNFEYSEYDLQEFALFCVCVAGKRADDTAQKLDKFLLAHAVKNMTPFQAIRMLRDGNALPEWLKIYKFGQYNRIVSAFLRLTSVDLRTATLETLETIMGPKSARFFLLNTRPNQRVAALDRHILAELRQWYAVVGHNSIPKSTPPRGPKYHLLEKLWLDHCDKLGRDPAELDLEVWNRRSGNGPDR